MQKNRSKDKLTDEKLDDQFVYLLKKIQTKYLFFNRHIQIRIQKWVQKLLQCDENIYWRKSRNNYITLLYQMVANQKITGIFLKMPPDKYLPHFSDYQHKTILQQLKILPQSFNYQSDAISITKILCPHGDHNDHVTPECQTQRQPASSSQDNQHHCIESVDHQLNANNQIVNVKHNDNKYQLLDKITILVTKYSQKLSNDPQFISLIQNLKDITNKQNICYEHQQSSSGDLKVQQGIAMNMVNLLQFGSPRTQIQYFKAALL